MKKKTIAIFLAAMISAQPCGMVYAEDFSADVSVESSELEEQVDELPDVEEENSIAGEDMTEMNDSQIEDDNLTSEDILETEDFETETVSAEDSEEIASISIVSEPISKDYYYGMYSDNVNLSGLVLEIHYTDNQKELLEFSEVGEIETDSRGNSFNSKIVHYVDGEAYDLDDDYDENYNYYGFVPKGSYEVVIYQEAELFEKVYSMKLNFVDRDLQNRGDGIFSTVIDRAGFIRFIPEKDGVYSFSKIYTDSTDELYPVYDSELHEMQSDVNGEKRGFSLKEECVYYIYISYYDLEDYETVTVNAERLPAIKSIQLEGEYKSATYYTPVNFGTGEKNKYSIVPSPWLGKNLKITYEDGTTESIGVYKFNRFYGRNGAYLVYSGSQDVPEAGTYDVHFELAGKEAVLKNGVQVKNMSQMPAIMGRGTKEMAVTGTTAYVCLKTTSATSYAIKGEPRTNAYLTISQLKNGKLEQVLSVENGKSCTLKPNSIYYIGMRLYSSVLDLDKVKFTVSSTAPKVQMSKTKISIGTLSYTGSNVKPSVTVKNGSKTLRQNTDYTISYSRASKVGAAVKITITGKGSYTGKVVKTVYIVPARPTISSLRAGKKNMTVIYKKTAGASGYQIAYSTNQKSGYKYVNLNNKTAKKTISKLVSGKKYYVKVRAYRTINGKRYYGNYSAVKSVKVK